MVYEMMVGRNVMYGVWYNVVQEVGVVKKSSTFSVSCSACSFFAEEETKIIMR
jgi:hypothetical protein